jgi:hypothetical protein
VERARIYHADHGEHKDGEGEKYGAQELRKETEKRHLEDSDVTDRSGLLSFPEFMSSILIHFVSANF